MSYSAGLLKVDTLNVPGASGSVTATNINATNISTTNLNNHNLAVLNNLNVVGDLRALGLTF